MYFLPNILTLFRILLTPLFLYFIFNENHYFIAIVIFTIASITDFFDGKVARKYNANSEFGKFLDPLADKVLILSTFAAFYFLNIIPLWFLIIIFIRDLLITCLRIFMIKTGNSLQTSKNAKFKTTFQFIFIYFLFLFLLCKFYFASEIQLLVIASSYILPIFTFFIAFSTIESAMDYLHKIKAINQSKVVFKTYEFLTTFFYIGKIKYAPGTIASFIAMLLFLFLPQVQTITFFQILFILFTLGVVSSKFVAEKLGQKDPAQIVIDEVVGMWFATFMLPQNFVWYFATFFIFRFFDIFKPFLIKKVEKINGGLGIMLDDILAAFYTNLIIFILMRFLV
ncbi:TPA: CDP-diacylglycerol--glycerol-3-phosphate 3-phosphatidyltransferase [Candidatus Dependentiae bacterium]|nr:MAG: CDP-diacylglycerol-glycerol-3-phosphate 3-phosphatidyltransferase [candidate division TM6 bacterium GW2011_GWE2_31_21]KKP53945.1 MAG: CDP-diacylglycerol-glycerol-3-phosphate 3-phosphatidyltransferase [candidate division TM6 bacterium GW2011_GWF2_33_332]HBS47725.1 CDP-diacylglycerol--glycerol-3-phosphate 3-phosphatidyltransferase [Candidatus Dependentiae bacterium]HBZ73874.1 CDP-diacylglycerol--glycerol-3-phosphate 3-phosphatidyltransferase [Candidatus Dependentiae bacterium]